ASRGSEVLPRTSPSGALLLVHATSAAVMRMTTDPLAKRIPTFLPKLRRSAVVRGTKAPPTYFKASKSRSHSLRLAATLSSSRKVINEQGENARDLSSGPTSQQCERFAPFLLSLLSFLLINGLLMASWRVIGGAMVVSGDGGGGECHPIG